MSTVTLLDRRGLALTVWVVPPAQTLRVEIPPGTDTLLVTGDPPSPNLSGALKDAEQKLDAVREIVKPDRWSEE